jgi:hypothetical protein
MYRRWDLNMCNWGTAISFSNILGYHMLKADENWI